MPDEPILYFVATPHALVSIQRRGLTLDLVKQILAAPEQRIEVRPGRAVLQSRHPKAGTAYLIRVIVDVDRRPPIVVTAYRTSRIAKYWRLGL